MFAERLGIVEFRNIISAINELYGINFSDYALTSFKRRVEKFIIDNRFLYSIEFIEKIKEDRPFFEKFLKEISVKDTEMFRDPSFWQCLKREVVPKLDEGDKIWVANTNSGEELYSLAILLRECGVLDHVKIIVTNISQKNIDFIKTGAYEMKKIDTYHPNYERSGGYRKLPDYFISNNNKAYMDSSLIDNVEFMRWDVSKDSAPGEFKFVLLRNYMLYFNKTLQNKVLDLVFSSLPTRGFLAIGIKENIEDSVSGRYLLINKEEKIYKKIAI